MSCLHQKATLPAAILVIPFLISTAGFKAHADETRATFRFEEHRVEFHNQHVRLAGSLLLPTSEVPVPAVVFVHGAGPQTRESYRERAEYFASQGIAALIYDKRGTGQSGGAYESYEPADLPASNRVANLIRAICALNILILVTFSIIALWVIDQLHPSCPTVLLFIPTLGSVSTLATVVLVVVLARTFSDDRWTASRKVRVLFNVLCLVLFVPYMYYWNLIGFRL